MILARLLSATPQTDGEHWDLAFRWHYDAWHTDAYAQNPAPYQRNPQLGPPNRPPYPWRPGFGDGGSIAELQGKFGFNLKINTANSPVTLDISGFTPVNTPPSGPTPQTPLQATVSTTGGSIPSGTYLLSISAGPAGPVSQYFITAIIPAGTTTGSITISGVVWQAAAAAVTVFAGTCSFNVHEISSLSWTGSSNDTFGNPTVFTITTIDPDGAGLPDPAFNSFLFQVKDIVHGGVWGAAANSAGITGGFATATFTGVSWTTNQWAGYTLSSYGGVNGGSGGVAPFDWVVASNTANTLTFVSIHGPTTGVVVVMRAKAASISANTIGDPNFVNSFGPSGLTVNAEAGNLIRIIAGKGANQPPIPILSNTATVFTLASNWAITPDSTSQYIVEAPAWRYSIAGDTIVNSGSGASPVIGSIPVVNFAYGALLVEVITVDAGGRWSAERYAPIREVWVPPTNNSAVNPGYIPVTPVAGVVTIDLSLGKNFGLQLTSGSAPTIAPPIFTGAAGNATQDGQDFSLYLFQDSSGDRAGPHFSNAAGGFVSNTEAQITVDGTPSTETAVNFTRKNGLFSLDWPAQTAKSIT
ncbi:MAG TPA: hypothetical protein VHY84_27415 [Bryobacteraceae bacterium]|jgi:hypothetical protein|nr:hypothetical protein [Bryobacteraceae bacterium]